MSYLQPPIVVNTPTIFSISSLLVSTPSYILSLYGYLIICAVPVWLQARLLQSTESGALTVSTGGAPATQVGLRQVSLPQASSPSSSCTSSPSSMAKSTRLSSPLSPSLPSSPLTSVA